MVVKSLDDLIRHLLEEIALSGDQGKGFFLIFNYSFGVEMSFHTFLIGYFLFGFSLHSVSRISQISILVQHS